MRQELSHTFESVSESQEKLLEIAERTQGLLKEAPDDFRKQFFQEIKELDKESAKKKWNLSKTDPGRNFEGPEVRQKRGRDGKACHLRSNGQRQVDLNLLKWRLNPGLLTGTIVLKEGNCWRKSRTWKKRRTAGGTPKWREGERSLLLKVASLGQRHVNLKLLKWRLNSRPMSWMADIAGSAPTPKTMEVSTSSEEERKVSSVERLLCNMYINLKRKKIV